MTHTPDRARPAGPLVALLLCSVLAEPASGQSDDAFSWARIGVGVGWMAPRLPGGEVWRPDPGLVLQVETPLRPGILGVGVHRVAVRAGPAVTDASVDRMTWTALHLAWGPEARLGPLAVGADMRLGTLVNTAPSGANRSERELVTGASVRAAWTPVESWAVRMEASLSRVHAHRPWQPATLSFGVTRRLGIGRRLAASVRAPGEPIASDTLAGGARREVASAAARTIEEPSWWSSLASVPDDALPASTVTTDFFDRSWSVSGLRPPEAGAPRLWLDGLPVKEATLGGTSWPWLPIGASDLASVRVTDHPAVLDGLVELDGAVAARTLAPSSGERVRARVLIMNESGDPGPLRYTEQSSPNVDGPLYELDASAGHEWAGGWALMSLAAHERWSVTRLRDRNPSFFRGSSSGVRANGGRLAVDQTLGAVSLRGRASVTVGDRYVRGPGIGRELAMDVERGAAGLSASLSAGAADTVEAYVALSGWDMVSPTERDPVASDPRALDWEERDLDIGVRFGTSLGPVRLVLGGDAGRALDRLDGSGRPRWTGSGHGSASVTRGGWAGELAIQAGSEGRGSGGVVRLSRVGAPGGWLAVSTSFVAAGPPGPLELWDRGVASPELFERLSVEVTELAPRDPGYRATVRFEGARRVGRGETGGALFIHAFRGERRPAPLYGWDGETVRGAWGPVLSGEGEVAGATLRATAPWGPVSVEALATVIEIRGSSAFESWWSGAPTVRSRAVVLMPLRPGWTLRGVAHVRSAASWDGFEGVPPTAALPGGGHIPAAALADVRLEGRVLAGRMRVVAGVTNVFDADARLHPLGAPESRGLLLGAGWRF